MNKLNFKVGLTKTICVSKFKTEISKSDHLDSRILGFPGQFMFVDSKLILRGDMD